MRDTRTRRHSSQCLFGGHVDRLSRARCVPILVLLVLLLFTSTGVRVANTAATDTAIKLTRRRAEFGEEDSDTDYRSIVLNKNFAS